MPRLIVHGFTHSPGAPFYRASCVGSFLALLVCLGGCDGGTDAKVETWNRRVAEHERTEDAAKGDSVVSKGAEEHGRTVTYYIAGEKVKMEYHYHGRLVSCYNYANGKLNGYGIEWNRDGTLYFVAHYVDGKLDGTTETHWREFGQKAFTTYRMGERLQSDTVPLTDRDSPHFERDVVKR